MSKKVGRPTVFTLALAELICEKVATNSCGLNKLCKIHEELPSEATIKLWRLKYPDFSAQYARAKLQQADILAEQCLEIADDCNPDNYAQARLRIDTRKWLASKLLPKQYGDKYILDQKNKEDEKLNAEMKALRAHLDAQNKREY